MATLGVASFPGSRNACSLSSWRAGIWSDSNSITKPDDCGKTENKRCGKPTVLDLNTGPSSALNGLSKDQHLCVLSAFLSSSQRARTSHTNCVAQKQRCSPECDVANALIFQSSVIESTIRSYCNRRRLSKN